MIDSDKFKAAATIVKDAIDKLKEIGLVAYIQEGNCEISLDAEVVKNGLGFEEVV